MNLGIRESAALARGILRSLRGRETAPEVIVCPSFVALSEVRKALSRSRVKLGAQNCGPEKAGAYTGEVAAPMLEDAGCEFVIIGHSERRQYFGETNELVKQRLQMALESNLIPIVCVGEPLEVREAGKALEYVEEQIKAVMSGVNFNKHQQLIIAYEPIWAIGTGKVAEVADAVAMQQHIRNLVSQLSNLSADRILVIYGGSVDAENAYALMRESEVDGVLVGGASIKLQQFEGIIAAGSEVMVAQQL